MKTAENAGRTIISTQATASPKVLTSANSPIQAPVAFSEYPDEQATHTVASEQLVHIEPHSKLKKHILSYSSTNEVGVKCKNAIT